MKLILPGGDRNSFCSAQVHVDEKVVQEKDTRVHGVEHSCSIVLKPNQTLLIPWEWDAKTTSVVFVDLIIDGVLRWTKKLSEDKLPTRRGAFDRGVFREDCSSKVVCGTQLHIVRPGDFEHLLQVHRGRDAGTIEVRFWACLSGRPVYGRSPFREGINQPVIWGQPNYNRPGSKSKDLVIG